MLEAKPKEKMKMTKVKNAKSVAAKIRAYMKAHPTARPSFVAKELGCNPSQVYAERYAMKQITKKASKWMTTMVAVSGKSITDKLAEGANGTSVLDMVNHPPHYKVGGIETISFIKAKLTKDEYTGYLRGNVLKYASRLGSKKDTVEDAGKLAWYSKQLEQALKG
jgi:hypothetical protein